MRVNSFSFSLDGYRCVRSEASENVTLVILRRKEENETLQRPRAIQDPVSVKQFTQRCSNWDPLWGRVGADRVRYI
jgi:hypothetical protein